MDDPVALLHSDAAWPATACLQKGDLILVHGQFRIRRVVWVTDDKLTTETAWWPTLCRPFTTGVPHAALLMLRTELRRRIVLAAPTCNLWAHDTTHDRKVFKLWPRWTISCVEYWAARDL